VPKMITIGLVGSAPHMREIYSYPRCLPFFLFFRNGKSHLDPNASIDADFLKDVPFGGLEVCKENFRGQICPPKLKNFLTTAKA
jgi:hypothetical protein